MHTPYWAKKKGKLNGLKGVDDVTLRASLPQVYRLSKIYIMSQWENYFFKV